MKKQGRKRGKAGSDRPTSREDGAIRIGRYMRWLYGPEARPADFAGPLIDAAFAEIAAIEDDEQRRALLRDALDRAYSGLGDGS